MACIFAQGLTLEPFLPQVLFIKTWAAIFAVALPPVNIAHLTPAADDLCNPLIT